MDRLVNEYREGMLTPLLTGKPRDYIGCIMSAEQPVLGSHLLRRISVVSLTTVVR